MLQSSRMYFSGRLAHSCVCLNYIPKRTYADFLKDLPRVGGGISRISKNTQKPSGPTGKNTETNLRLNQNQNAPKGNRFAQQYSQPKKKNDLNNKPKNQNRFTKEEKVELDRTQQYNTAKKALKDKEKNQAQTKQQTNKSPSPKPRLQKPTKKAETKVENIKIQVPTFITVSNLSTIMGVPLSDLLKKLEILGFEGMTHNYILDKENASLIADEYGFEVTMNDDTGADLFPSPECEDESKLKPRAPVVTIMGHVDHGKTTILDYLRKSSVVAQEHGGITQHIGAFSVITPISKQKITFLDTPGHAAFLKMRERGAIITDIVILVVAADDSVMPQTIEAIKHAKKSGVPMIVAINKCDKPGVNTDRVLADLSRHGIDVEEYGGDTQTVQVSGKTGLNMDKLEEAVITLREMSDFRSEISNIPSEGWVIESEIAKGMGNISTVLVRRGTVKVGSYLVAGNTYCKVRGMKDENGKTVKTAGPSTPVQIWGWKDLPQSGDQILEAKNERNAKKVCENRINREKQIKAAGDIETINKKRQAEIKELERQEKINELKLAGFDEKTLKSEFESEPECIKVKYIIKSDVFGSAEAIKGSIDGLGNEEVKSVVILHEAGMPSDSDVDRAKALDAKILCFNVKTPKAILAKADKNLVDIKEYNIIYRLIEDVTNELTSHLKPHVETKILGEVEIKDVFSITSKTKLKFKIAGCKVTNGNIKRSSKIKVLRGKNEIFNGSLSSLKHVKDDISEAKRGNECGISFDNWDKFQAGDIIQVYEEIIHPRYL
ncbi:unnamed protein product [Debaryomyces tyrocola]|nr:unnamed protein product [Debaryomyces tyrocola]